MIDISVVGLGLFTKPAKGGVHQTCQTRWIEQALALARDQAPDVVISDYRLREQRTGVEAIAALRELAGLVLPALLITGDTASDRLREAQASGIALLHKPVSPSQSYRTLVTVIEASAAHSLIK